MSNLKTARYLADILSDKKASDILILNVGRFTMAAEYFVIATASSEPHRRTLIEELKKKSARSAASNAVPPKLLRIEGKKESPWVVADFGGAMVHIMSKEERRLVALENLYDGARRLHYCAPRQKIKSGKPKKRKKV